MKWIIIALIGATTACAAGTPPQGGATTVAAPRAPFANYQSFTFGLSRPPRDGYEVTERSLEVQRRLRTLVEAGLQERGYALTPDGADLIVKLASGTGEGPNPAAERAVGPAPARGYIGVDIYDASSGSMVWAGTAFAEIDPLAIDDALLARGVERMLGGFPARSNRPTAAAE